MKIMWIPSAYQTIKSAAISSAKWKYSGFNTSEPFTRSKKLSHFWIDMSPKLSKQEVGIPKLVRRPLITISFKISLEERTSLS